MARKRNDLTNQRFGKLLAIKFDSVDKRGNARWECKCDCGNVTIVPGCKLLEGCYKSCGKRGCKIHISQPYADLTGRVFGRLTVLGVADVVVYGKQKCRTWYCLCSCGNKSKPFTRALIDGTAQSCGCLARELKAVEMTTHGRSRSKEYILFHSAKNRARVLGLPFNLELSDIVIPEYCPLLGTKIESGKTICRTSPTVDRITPKYGYVKGNVWVISQKANRMKSDMTLEQMRHFVTTIDALTESVFADALRK